MSNSVLRQLGKSLLVTQLFLEELKTVNMTNITRKGDYSVNITNVTIRRDYSAERNKAPGIFTFTSHFKIIFFKLLHKKNRQINN